MNSKLANRNLKKDSPWAWVPTLYFAEGLPYIAVMTLSLVMYKRMGISNAEVALYTGWLNLPWVVKPLWSPFVDLVRTKRWWVVAMQMLIGAALAGIAFLIPAPHFFQSTLALFWLMAFASATHSRHCSRRVLYVGAYAAPASFVCGHPEHLLPPCHHRRPRIAPDVCRLVGTVG